MSFRPRSRLAFAVSFLVALGYAGCSAGGNDSGGGGGGKTGGSGGKDSGTGGIQIGGTGGFNFDGSSGTGGSAGDACASTEVTGTLVPANLYFVIDQSGSMNCNLESDCPGAAAQCEQFPTKQCSSKPSRWELTKAALKSAFTDLQSAGNVSAGLVPFPTPNTDGSACGVTDVAAVPIKPLDAAQNSALASYLDSMVPLGKTPLAGATILSYKYLKDQFAALPGNPFVVLLTDGFETCNTAAIPDLLADPGGYVYNALSALGIRTFVIGVPGSEDGRALLSQIAWIGGTPKSPTCTHDPTPANVGDCHFDMTTSANFSSDLKAALAAISGSVLKCELDMPKPPEGKKINYNSVTVTNNGTAVTKDDSKPCDQGANGWQFNADKTQILLCGTACSDAQQTGVTLKINLGCLLDIK